MLSLQCALILCIFVTAKTQFRYPGAQPHGIPRHNRYPARIPGFQNPIEQARRLAETPTQSRIKPTSPPINIKDEETWDETVTQWVTEIDPALARTITVIITPTVAKFQIEGTDEDWSQEPI